MVTRGQIWGVEAGWEVEQNDTELGRPWVVSWLLFCGHCEVCILPVLGSRFAGK